MKRRLLKGLKVTAAVILILVGVVGLFLPVLQGMLLILLGLLLLGVIERGDIKRWLARLKRKKLKSKK